MRIGFERGFEDSAQLGFEQIAQLFAEVDPSWLAAQKFDFPGKSPNP